MMFDVMFRHRSVGVHGHGYWVVWEVRLVGVFGCVEMKGGGWNWGMGMDPGLGGRWIWHGGVG